MAVEKCHLDHLLAIDHPRRPIIVWEMDHLHLVTTHPVLHPLLRNIRERDCLWILLTNANFILLKNQ
jgi:hypothetical protein